MDSGKLTELAKLLRERGAEVLSGTTKLTLNFDTLSFMIRSFKLIVDQKDSMTSSFHVINTSSDRADLYCDLNFLHDFMQKSLSLRIIQPCLSEEIVDISIFKNLKMLECRKIDLALIRGMEAVKNRLQHLIIARCKNTTCFFDLCDVGEAMTKNWDELKVGMFTNHKWKTVKLLTPMVNLQTVDLSHNELEDTTDLNTLCNMKHLNLSFNRLVKVPEFSGPTCHLLQVLCLSYNFLEELTPLSTLTNLRELDLKQNSLVEHRALAPISHIATLQVLNLQDNPIVYHPQHRTLSASYLNKNTSTVRFLLDGKLLSSSEKKKIGTLHPRVRIRSSSSHSLSQSVEKPRRIRTVTITGQGYTPIIEGNDSAGTSLVTSIEHLDAKRQIEQLKKQYGNEWLNSQAGSLVQDVLGIEKSPVLSSTPSNLPVEFPINEITQTAVAEEQITGDTFVTATENLSLDDPAEANVYEQQVTNVETPEESTSDDENLGDGEENIHLAVIVDKEEPVFIVITKTHILERDCTTAMELTRWPIETLTTCESDENSITIFFDTLKVDARSRKYQWNKEDSPQLLNAIRALIEMQPAPESKLSVYKCLKCSTQFGVEDAKTLFDVNTVCPTCESNLVFEDDS